MEQESTNSDPSPPIPFGFGMFLSSSSSNNNTKANSDDKKKSLSSDHASSNKNAIAPSTEEMLAALALASRPGPSSSYVPVQTKPPDPEPLPSSSSSSSSSSSTSKQPAANSSSPSSSTATTVSSEGGSTKKPPPTSSTTATGSSTSSSNIPEKSARIRLPLAAEKKGKAVKSQPPRLVPLPEEEVLSEKAAMTPLLPLSGSGGPSSSSRLLTKGGGTEGGGGSESLDVDESETDQEPPPSIWTRVGRIYTTNEFVILVLVSILFARAYPPLGARYLAPKITAGWIYVCIIFVLSGLGLKTEAFAKAFQQLWFNLYVQVFNFALVSAAVYVGCSGLVRVGILSRDLADGMIVCSCLPMTINMIIVLAKASGGDESLAVVNAAAGNMIGVFVSPVLILGYLGVKGDVDLTHVFFKLALRVVLPVMVGQTMRKTMPRLMAYQRSHKKQFRKFQEYSLCFIVYTVFCRTFENGKDSAIVDIFAMIAFVFLFLILFMALAWLSLGLLFPDHPEMRVMGLFACTHKTVSMGVPVINAIYEDDPALGLYTLPLLIWHPMQLVLGSFLAPHLEDYVYTEKIRLGRHDEPDTSTSDPGTRGGARPKRHRPSAPQGSPENDNNDDTTNNHDDTDGVVESTIELGNAPTTTTTNNKMTPKGSELARISQFEGGSNEDPTQATTTQS